MPRMRENYSKWLERHDGMLTLRKNTIPKPPEPVSSPPAELPTSSPAPTTPPAVAADEQETPLVSPSSEAPSSEPVSLPETVPTDHKFRKAQHHTAKRMARLVAAVASGELSPEDAEQRQAQMVFEHGGVIWALGAQTGSWYCRLPENPVWSFPGE